MFWYAIVVLEAGYAVSGCGGGGGLAYERSKADHTLSEPLQV
jgi:hypothetical protein